MSSDKQNPKIWLMPTTVKTYDHQSRAADQYVNVGLNNSTDVNYNAATRKIKIRPHVQLNAQVQPVYVAMNGYSYDSRQMTGIESFQYLSSPIPVVGSAIKINFKSISTRGTIIWCPLELLACLFFKSNYVVELLRDGNVVRTSSVRNLDPNVNYVLTDWEYGFSQGVEATSTFYLRITITEGAVYYQDPDFEPWNVQYLTQLWASLGNVEVTKPSVLEATDGAVNYAVVANYIVNG